MVLIRCSATIELRFQATNDPQDLNPPKVLKIAPMGSWGLQKSEKTEESKLGAKVDAGATFVANVSAGLEWSMTTTQTQCNEAKLEGGPTKRGRKIEPKNAAVWSMSENQDTEKGIPSLLRTVVLLERKNYVDFYCSILVKTKVHWWPEGLSPSVESRETGGNTNHVLFSPTMKRTKLPLAGIEPSELDKVVLNEWMAVTTRESIAPPLPATVLRDGQISNLTHTTQKSEELIPMAGESILKLNGTHSSEPKMEGQYPFKTSAQADKPLHITDAALKKAILDPLRGIGMHPSQKVDDPVPKLTDVNGSLPRGSKLEEGFSVEETLRLLLHAVRKGVEVIAEAVRMWNIRSKRI